MDLEMNRLLLQLLEPHGMTLSAEQLDQLEAYYRILVEWNERMNLTGITEKDQVYIKHFYDSLSVAFFHRMDLVERMADIGSGAGFPGIPLAIAFPAMKLTIIDSLQKRIQFLQHLTTELGLCDVSCIHGRAEDIARLSDHRDQYDLVSARAVAKLSVLNEFCLPFVKDGGTFVAMKGSSAADELEEASYSLSQLRGKIDRVEKFTLPVEDAGRQLIFIQKLGPTPARYPRKPGLPLKEPLIR